MSIKAINQTIRHMCDEISGTPSLPMIWTDMSESKLLYEVAVCVCGSQMLFESSLAIADRLRHDGILSPDSAVEGAGILEERMVSALASPVWVTLPDGSRKSYRPRFKHRLASLLASTMQGIYCRSESISGFLWRARDARDARETLIQSVFGFGPKQASLFLRRIGYCADLAVLDVHVLDYLRLAKGLTVPAYRLGNLSTYEQLENIFREVATDFGYPLGCVDLATWLTMRVAKREAML
ncbi:8-oxoguanine DNA glycosylase [Achromobacter denitrificans]